MRLEVEPGVGIGPVRLGMHRDEVRHAIDSPVHEFTRPGLAHPVDAFLGNALQVFYAAGAAVVEYVELANASGVQAVLDNVDVFDTTAAELVAILAAHYEVDAADPEFGYSYRYPTAGLSLWRPTVPESVDDSDGRNFSTVGVSCAGGSATPG